MSTTSGHAAANPESIFLIPTATLALIVLVIYLIACLRKRKPFDHRKITITVFHSAEAVTGGLLVASTFSPTLRDSVAHIQVYIFLGGVTVFAAALEGLVKAIVGPADRA